jgi:hypothetical protein
MTERRVRTIKRRVIRDEVIPPNDDCPISHDERPPFTTPPQPKMTLEQAMSSVEEMFAAHAECKWVKVGRCVFCDTHNMRLYEGDLPRAKR